MACRWGSKAKATRQDCPFQANLNAFILGCREPLCVDRVSTQMRSEFGQQTSMRQQLILQTLRQTLELCVEWIVKDNRPGHLNDVLNNIIWSNPAKRRFLLEPLPLGFSVFAMSACPC